MTWGEKQGGCAVVSGRRRLARFLPFKETKHGFVAGGSSMTARWGERDKQIPAMAGKQLWGRNDETVS
jgi:hypothetical protein